MPEQELYAQQFYQQVNQDRATSAKFQAQDRSRQSASAKITNSKVISTTELFLIGMLAALKDTADIICDLLIIGPIINILTNIFVLPILWFWCLTRLHKFPTKKFIGAALGKFIPYLDAIPYWTGFVAMIFLEQKGFMPKFMQRLAKAVPGK